MKDDFHGIKKYARYHNFTAFYKKINEHYRMLIEQKIIKPVRIFRKKRDYRNDSDIGGWAVEVEDNLVEETVRIDLVAGGMDTEEKVAEARATTVTVYKDNIMKQRESPSC